MNKSLRSVRLQLQCTGESPGVRWGLLQCRFEFSRSGSGWGLRCYISNETLRECQFHWLSGHTLNRMALAPSSLHFGEYFVGCVYDDTALVHSGCYNSTAWLMKNRIFFSLTVLKMGSLRRGCHHGPLRALFWVTDFL